jgi:hypothetical protein
MHKRTCTFISSGVTPGPIPAEADLNQKPTPDGRCRTKRCRACGMLKALNCFHRANGQSNRRRPNCKRCQAARASAGWQRKVAAGSSKLELKRCRRCSEIKPQTEFLPDNRCSGGRRREICLRCQAAAEAYRESAPLDLMTPDELIPLNSETHERRIDLGIAIAHATCPPGYRRTCEEIAAYANVSEETIRLIEEQALYKVRRRFTEVMQELGLSREEVAL